MDRRCHVKKQLDSYQIPFKFYNAISPERLEQYHEYFARAAFENLTSGSKGCAASHLTLWESIGSEEDEGGTGLHVILEDDAVLKKDFRSFLINQKLPVNVDILFLGGWNTRGRDINCFVSERVFHSFNPRKGLYAYALTVRGAKRLLANSIPLDIIYGGIDTKIGKLVRQGKLVAYHIYPNIVEVDLNSPSDIYNPSQAQKVLYTRS